MKEGHSPVLSLGFTFWRVCLSGMLYFCASLKCIHVINENKEVNMRRAERKEGGVIFFLLQMPI